MRTIVFLSCLLATIKITSIKMHFGRIPADCAGQIHFLSSEKGQTESETPTDERLKKKVCWAAHNPPPHSLFNLIFLFTPHLLRAL